MRYDRRERNLRKPRGRFPSRWLVVGAGFTGAILAERLASQRDATVLVIDRRNHVAGNAFDTHDADGIRVQAYGPHIFHTNSAEVVDYLSRFTAWRPYEHRVLGAIAGHLVPVPFNLTSLAMLFPAREAAALASLLIETYGIGRGVPILKMREAENGKLQALAEFAYENVLSFYSRKQWGLTPEELSPSVTARVPIRVSYDDRYFQDTFQKMPRDGYTRLFERILAHPKITVSLETSFDEMEWRDFDRIIHTGPIDAHFGFTLGALPYRSLRFDFRTYPGTRRQPVAQINYPVSEDFTRTTEMGHLTGEWGKQTCIATEYPMAHAAGENEPYYPIPRDENQALYNRYLALARREAPNVVFAGRLGDYCYYNMDQAAGRALSLFRKLAAELD